MLDEEAKSAAPLQARRLDVTLIGGDDGLRLPKLLADIGITVPFVVFTASAELQTGFEACQLGAFAIVSKPALLDDIATILRSAAASCQRAACEDSARSESGAHASYVQRAAAYMERNYSMKQLSVARIALEIGVSRDHLSRLFRQRFKCSLLTYLHRTRQNQAKRLLAGSVMSIKEVADICGYRQPAEFTRTFTRLAGCSPSKFRFGQVNGRLTGLAVVASTTVRP